MLKHALSAASIATLAAISLLGSAQGAQNSSRDLSGTYRCEPDPDTCQASGLTFTVTQQGTVLDVKNDKGDVGQVKLTSNISLSAGPPWNMLGVILPDNGTIQWSNGTRWRKA